MANVALNVDPRGYARGILQDLPGGAAGGGGAGGGLLPGMGGFLERMMRMREKLAQAQLAEMNQRYNLQQRAADVPIPRPTPGLGRTSPEDQAKMDRWNRSVAMADSLLGGPQVASSVQDRERLIKGIWAISPEAAHEGLMQSGRLFAGQSGAPVTSPGELAAKGFQTEPPRYGRVGPEMPSAPLAFDPSAYEGRAGLSAAQRRTGKKVRGGSYSIYGRPPTEGPTRGELGAFKKGGTVPSTGTYKLHKGEIVVPRENANPALVSILIRKKLAERAGKSYQGGTIEDLFRLAESGDVPSLREILRSQGMSDDEAREAVNRITRGAGGQVAPKTQRIQKIKDFLAPTPAPSMGIPKAAGTLALKEALGEEAPSAKRWPWWALAGGAPGRFLSKVGSVPPGRAAGEALSEQLGALPSLPAGVLGALGKGVGEPLGETEFMQGLVGPGEELFGAPPKTAPTETLPSQGALEALAAGAGGPPAPVPAEGSYEAAAARVRGGDFGTPEQPLVLRGEPSEIEQAQRDVENLPVYQEARHKSQMAEVEAERIFDMLRLEGHRLDPEVYSDLYQEGTRKMQLADRFRTIMERKEKTTEALLTSNQKLLQQVLRDLTRETAIGDRQKALEELRQRGMLSTTTLRGFAMSLPKLYGEVVSGNPAQRSRAEQQIAQIFRVIAAYRESAATGDQRQVYKDVGEQSDAYAQEFTKLPQDEVTRLAEKLLLEFGGTSELQGLLGGTK